MSSPDSHHPEPDSKKKIVKVWADGCFDMMHWGHANALRQAKKLGDYLIVGVHSDEEILKNKGPTVMKEEERYKAVESCKWVDEVVRGAPYVTSLEVMDQYSADFCAHGDDESITNSGEDSYKYVKEAGRFKTVPRTVGVSTTDLVGRMLLLNKAHHVKSSTVSAESLGDFTRLGAHVSHFTTTSKIVQFSEGRRDPKPGEKIVYIDGAFDLFHVGHIAILEKAKTLGHYLIVGVYDDETVNRIKGANFPILNLNERVLSCLQCKYVNEVIIGAPFEVTKEVLQAFGISVVVYGSVSDPCFDHKALEQPRYEACRELGVEVVRLESPLNVTTSDIIQRIIENRLQYEERNRRKAQGNSLKAP